ncbi:MAG: ATP-binding protein, partial [Psychromonas sp.]|nr:ATP-binding protein [Psychromonas sp.]
GGHLYAVLCDICAFANTNGGTIFVGLSDKLKDSAAGVNSPKQAIQIIRNDVEKKITPPLEIEIDEQQTQGKKVLEISVPVGANSPYVIDDYKIYVRDETDSNLAVRDEIVALVKRSLKAKTPPELTPDTAITPTPIADIDLSSQDGVSPEPKTGVEIVLTEARKGKQFYSLRDLRNGDIVHNVTRQSARRLWQYALTEHENNAIDDSKIEWVGDIGVGKKYKRGSQTRYDLVQRDTDNTLHVYYGVTEDGIHGPWQKLLDSDDNGNGS